ncbi:MAG TPA: hypothetical protein VK586_01255 [Streptosporangiaceae bacterium]|nr:hypothetical protein [Streptosporangiaceae bacterium]
MSFDAGSITASLEVDRASFAAGLAWARDEAKKGIQIPVRFDISQAAATAAIRGAQAMFRSSRASMPLSFDVSQAAVMRAVTAARAIFGSNRMAMPITFDVSNASVMRAVTAARAIFRANPITVPVEFSVSKASVMRAIATAKAIFAGQSATMGLNFSIPAGQILLTSAAMKSLVSTIQSSSSATGISALAWTRWGRVSLTALHWIVSGLSELTAVVLPATVAAAAWAAVWLQGTTNVAQHMQSVYTATEAMANMGAETAGQMIGLGNALQKAQDAANPDVYQALGGAIQVVKEQAGGIDQAGLQMGRIFDTFAAKLVMDFAAGGSAAGEMNAFLKNMVPDLTQIGEVFGNLGHALLSVGVQMPGLAEVLLKFLADFIGGISAVAQFAEGFKLFGVTILTAVMAVEEFMRWGGLLVTMLGGMGLATADLGTKFLSMQRLSGVFMTLFSVLPNVLSQGAMGLSNMIGKMGGLGVAGARAEGALADFSNRIDLLMGGIGPLEAVLITVAAVGLAVLIDKVVTATTEAQDFANALTAATDKARNLQVLSVAANNIGKLQAATQAANQQIHAIGQVGQTAANAMVGFAHGTAQAAVAQNDARSNIAAYKTGLDAQTTAVRNVLSGSLLLATTYHTTIPGAMALAQAAGVSLTSNITGQSQAADLARTKIADLVAGYMAMGAPLGVVGNDMTAVAIQTGLAGTQVSKLNSAWTEFMTNLTGGTTGLASLETGIQNMTSGIASAKDNLSKGGGLGGAAVAGVPAAAVTVGEFAKDLTNFGKTGSQAWQNFGQVVGSTAPQLINWLTTAGAEGAISGANFTQAVRDMVAQLLPFAKDSSTASAELGGLVQMAGGPAITSYAQLKSWTDQTKTSTRGLSDIIGTTTVKMGNMSQIASNLGTVVQSQLTSMMDQARLASSGVQKAINNYTDDLEHNTAGTVAGRAARTQLYNDLMLIFHNSATANQWIAALTKTVGGNTTTTQAGHETRAQLDADINNVFKVTPKAYDALETYNNNIRTNTGNTDAGRATRAQLVTDIVTAGLKAHDTMQQIVNMTTAILKIPKSEALTLVETATGSYSISQKLFPGSNLPPGLPKPNPKTGAAGMLVSGGTPGKDSVHILAMPGEALVPTRLVPHIAPFLGAHGVPGFAAGGIVPRYAAGGSINVSGAGSPAAIATMAATSHAALQSAVTAALEAGISKAQSAAAAAAFSGGAPGGAAIGAGAAAAQAYAKSILHDYGWGPAMFPPLQSLWNGESGWNYKAYNAASGATGIPQSLPGSKMASAGADWRTNPATQIRWGLGYIKGRYGSPATAYSDWLSRSPHWYAGGTTGAAPGWAKVGENGPEMVWFRGGERVRPSGASGGSDQVADGLGAICDLLTSLLAATRAGPGATAGGIGGVLGAAAQVASFRTRYPKNR